jgi:hypothetical protein
MRAFSRLSIWQRVWVVLSVGGLICITGFAIFLGPDGDEVNPNVSNGFGDAQCRPVIEMPSGAKLTPEPRHGDPCRALYVYRSAFGDARSTNAGYVEHMSSLRWAKQWAKLCKETAVWLIAVSLMYGIGHMVAWFARGRANLLFGVAAATCAWVGAFAIESATRLMARAFTEVGADLPAEALLVISAVQSYVLWIIAGASTLIIVYLWMRTSDYFLHACTVISAAVAVLVSFVTLSLALPIMRCGHLWPEWTTPAPQSSGTSEKASNHSVRRTGCAAAEFNR